MKKVVISSESLKPALKKLSQAVAKNSVLPILANLYLKVYDKEAEIITSDLELTIRHTLTCETTGGGFEILLPFEFVQKIVNLSGLIPITIEYLGAKKARILGSDDVYELNSLEKIDDFPKMPELPKKNFVKLNSGFIDWLNRAMTTCSKDETRPALQKSCLDIMETGVTIASTDSHCLFNYSLPVESPIADQLLISPKMAKAMEGFNEIEVYWHSKQIAFKSGDVTIIATRHTDKYPDYKVIIPNHEANLSINRNELIGAIERASLANDSHITMAFDKKTATIHLKSENVDFGRKTQIDIVGKYTGAAPFISLNPKKLLTLLHQVNYETVNLHIQSESRAMLISCESDKNYLGMIMPLLINQ